MGRPARELFPNAQRAQHYGTPPPESSPVTRSEAAADPGQQTEPLPPPPTFLTLPDGRVIPLLLRSSMSASVGISQTGAIAPISPAFAEEK